MFANYVMGPYNRPPYHVSMPAVPPTEEGGLISGSQFKPEQGELLDYCSTLSSLLSWKLGWLESISIDIVQFMMCAIRTTHNGLKEKQCLLGIDYVECV